MESKSPIAKEDYEGEGDCRDKSSAQHDGEGRKGEKFPEKARKTEQQNSNMNLEQSVGVFLHPPLRCRIKSFTNGLPMI